MRKFSLYFLLISLLFTACTEDIVNEQISESNAQRIMGSTALKKTDFYINLNSAGNYVDLEVKAHKTSNTSQLNSNYTIEWFIVDDWGWLKYAFNYEYKLLSVNKAGKYGKLCYAAHQGDYYKYNYAGYKAEYLYYVRNNTQSRFIMLKSPENPSENSAAMFIIPIRAKLTPKKGGAVLTYDIGLRSVIWGGIIYSYNWDYSTVGQ
ncbi:hypothetical protein O2K51_08450 [Apibacter raozihei]|uniref:hypothetical protein n=1 Tax=Apibacter TaxID=1778601 RepID=UPI000FE2AD89|nr:MULTISPECIES: hypothetical protein [Apibacter]